MTYLPDHFRQNDPAQLRDLMRASPLAVLTSFGGGRLHVSHVPLLFDDAAPGPGRLLGHLAAANPQAREHDPAIESVAVFTGPDVYVSPAFYETKRLTGKVVPTWNYIAVYAWGRIRFLDDHEEKHGVVSVLTDAHESRRAGPWAVTDAPDEFVAAQLRAVRAFEMRIERLEGKWKLSQNRSQADRDGVRAALGASESIGAAGVHAAMERLAAPPD